MRPRAVMLAVFVAATVVFCVVQDRLTAAGARQYVERQRQAMAGDAPPVTIDEVMAPAVGRSVRQGLLWGGLVAAGGVVFVVARRPRRQGGGA